MRKQLILLFCFLLSISSYANTVSIRADYWYPMNGKPGSENPGYMIEFARLIFGRHGYDIDYQLMPWQRAVTETEAGKFDCVVGAYHDDAPNFVFPKESWGRVTTAIYVRNEDEFIYTDIDSLTNRTIGIIEGYAYSAEDINKAIELNEYKFSAVTGAEPLSANIQKLLHGRIDTIIENPAVMSVTMHELNLSGKIKLAGYVGQPSNMYIACSPANKKSLNLIKIVDEGTKTLRRSGELQQILQNYGLNDWQKN